MPPSKSLMIEDIFYYYFFCNNTTVWSMILFAVFEIKEVMFLFQVLVLKVESGAAQLYVSWSGETTRPSQTGEDTVVVSGLLASKAGLRHGDQVTRWPQWITRLLVSLLHRHVHRRRLCCLRHRNRLFEIAEFCSYFITADEHHWLWSDSHELILTNDDPNFLECEQPVCWTGILTSFMAITSAALSVRQYS